MKTSRLVGLVAAGAVVGVGLVIVALSVGGCEMGSGCHRMGMGSPAPGPVVATPAAGSPANPAGVVNARCPIMGGTINTATVPESLTREYKGQKVAFCCAMCPGQWDKLSDADKDAKLSKVVATAK